MKTHAFALAILVVLALCSGSFCWGADGISVNVADFGAVPNDGKDDTPAIRKAIEACADVKDVTLIFGPGRFDIQGPGKHGTFFVLHHADGLTVEGRGALFMLHEPGTLFAVADSRRVRIADLTIDMDPLPFAGGRVVDRGEGWFDLNVAPPHQVREGQRVLSVLAYDLENRRVGAGTDIYQLQSTNKTERVGDNTMRIRTAQKPPEMGAHVTARYQVYGRNGFHIGNSSDVQLESITIHTIAGMGLYATNSENLSLTKFCITLPPGSGRWMTATADATHFNNCRGEIRFEDCLFEAMGDDAANIHQMYLKVTQRIDDRTFRLAFARENWWSPEQAPRPGDVLEFGTPTSPLTVAATATVESLEVDASAKSLTIRLAAPLPETVTAGSIVGNVNACPRVRIRGCTVRNNRARGFLIQSRDVLLENNRFEYCSAGAVHICCDSDYWCEGMATRDVTLRGNTFVGCNFWRGHHGAAVAVFADTKNHKVSPGIHKKLHFEKNVVREGHGAGLYVSAAEDVLIRGNILDTPGHFGVIVRDSRNVRITGNTVPDPAKLIHVGERCQDVATDAAQKE
ncbi:MAG: hypothetical protein GY851_34035 [bacterium]|nr:hypothetical protein [bacterium]